MNEQFRGSFAKPFLCGSAIGSDEVNGGKGSTVAAVLVLVAGDMTVRSIQSVRCSSQQQSMSKSNFPSLSFLRRFVHLPSVFLQWTGIVAG